MNERDLIEKLTKDELLELEQLCDSFEDQLRSSGPLQPTSVAALEPFVAMAKPKIRTRLRAELMRIAQDWCVSLNSNSSPNASTHTMSILEAPESTVDAHSVGNAHKPFDSEVFDYRFQLQGRIPARFRLEFPLGRGASAEVWLAQDSQLNRRVAIKIAHQTGVPSPIGFLREARSSSRLAHPNIVRVLEIASEQSWPYLVSEYIDGESLERRLNQEILSPQTCANWVAAIADALAYAHAQGIVHRDIKPQNILIDKSDHVRITDFGIAKDFSDIEATHTDAGQCIGTPAYMSPQQASGQSPACPSDDVYAIGVVLYRMLTGEVPFRGNSQSVLFQLMHSDPRPIRESHPEVPWELELLCMKCIEKRTADRLPSAAFLRDELNRYLRNEPLISRPVTRIQQVIQWSRRNPRLAQSLATISGLLILLTCSSLVFAWSLQMSWKKEHAQFVLAQHERKISEHERKISEQERKLSEQVVGFMETIFQSTDPVYSLLQESSGKELPTLQSVLENASSRVETELRGQPQLQQRLFDILANAYRSSGFPEQAQKLFRMSEELHQQSGSENMGSIFRQQTDRGMHAYYLGCLSHDQGDLEAAQRAYEEALDKLSDAEPGAYPSQLAISEVEFQLGRLFLDRRDNATALHWMTRCLQHRRLILPEDSTLVRAADIATMLCRVTDDADWPEQLSTMIGSESSWSNDIIVQFAKLTVARGSRQSETAKRLFDQLIENLEKSLSPRHPITLLALGDYAGWLHEQGEYQHAYPVAAKLIEIATMVAPNHPKLRQAKLQFAYELTRSTRLEEANRLYQEVLDSASNASLVSLEAQLGHLWCSLALSRSDGIATLVDSLAELHTSKPPHEAAWCAYAASHGYDRLGDLNRAKQFHSLALESARNCQPVPENPMWLQRLATIHSSQGEFEKAIELLQIAVSIERSLRPPQHPRLADSLLELSIAFQRRNRVEDALPLIEEAIAIYSVRMPEGDMRTQNAKNRLTLMLKSKQL